MIVEANGSGAKTKVFKLGSTLFPFTSVSESDTISNAFALVTGSSKIFSCSL